MKRTASYSLAQAPTAPAFWPAIAASLSLFAIATLGVAAMNANAAIVSIQDHLAESYFDVFYTVSDGGEFTNWDLRVTPEAGGLVDPQPDNRAAPTNTGNVPIDTFANTVFSSLGAGQASHIFTQYNPGSAFPLVPADPAPTHGATGAAPGELNWSIFDVNRGDGNNLSDLASYHMARVVYSPGGHGAVTMKFFDTTNAGVGEGFTANYGVSELPAVSLILPPPVTPPPAPNPSPAPPVVPPIFTPPALPPVTPTPPANPPVTGRTGNVTLARQSRTVTAEEVAGGAPAGGFVHEFFVTSDTDLLLLGDVNVSAPLFQHTLGSDVAPPHNDDHAAAPAVTADSFISLPGETQSLGGGFEFGPGDQCWFDISNDGGQQDFLFARLTTTGETGSFTGRMDLRGYDGVVSLPFDFLLPGTESDMLLVASEPTYALEYSLDPPVPPIAPPQVIPLPVVPPPDAPRPIPPALPEPAPQPEEPVVVVVPPNDPPPVEPPATPPGDPAASPEPAVETPIYVMPVFDPTRIVQPIFIDPSYTIDVGLVGGGVWVWSSIEFFPNPELDFLLQPDWANIDTSLIDYVYDGDLSRFHLLNQTVGDFGLVTATAANGAASPGIGSAWLFGSSADGMFAIPSAALASAHIPEPTAYVLLATCLLSLVALRRRRAVH